MSSDSQAETTWGEIVTDETLARSISYCLKQNRKAIRKLDSRDDEGHLALARRFVAQLRLSGVVTVRDPDKLLTFSHLGGGPPKDGS